MHVWKLETFGGAVRVSAGPSSAVTAVGTAVPRAQYDDVHGRGLHCSTLLVMRN